GHVPAADPRGVKWDRGYGAADGGGRGAGGACKSGNFKNRRTKVTMFNLDKLLRDNIKRLVPYSSARDEFKGEASVFLDANENSFGSPLEKDYNRYPDPMQWKIKYKLADIKGVPPQNIFLGNGSDECIDVLYRAFCRPGVDNVV